MSASAVFSLDYEGYSNIGRALYWHTLQLQSAATMLELALCYSCHELDNSS